MLKKVFALSVVFLGSMLPISADELSSDQLSDEWITERQMKQLSHIARNKGALLSALSCRFTQVENPGRSDVRFKPAFEQPETPQAWGWTFDANAPNQGAEQQAKQAGFVVAAEDYYEITGVTWVRCKVWHRP